MNLHLNAAQIDRACGVLIASAAGDALGAGYEFAPVAADLVPEMIGGGLGNFAPGEWTDDTAQAVAIAEVAASGADLRSQDALDGIAQRFADWYAGDPADVGTQTSAVLSAAGRHPTGASMAAAAAEVHARQGRSAGNGSLMRTGPVALAHLDDPVALVEAAMAVSGLTHHQEVAREACAVWCLLIRHAVLQGQIGAFDDIRAWVPNPDYWERILFEAEFGRPEQFTQNGWAVGALQAAWSAITSSFVEVDADAEPCTHLQAGLTAAIRIGHDTDTVAAIAGALLGARWGMSAVPAAWRRMVHGWPGRDAHDLERLACLTVRGGRGGKYDWPLVDHIDYRARQYVDQPLASHPHDDGVWLAGATVLDDLPDGVDAVVSICLTGSRQVPDGVQQIGFRIMDEAGADHNPNLDFALLDAARTVQALRKEGRTVLLHCVAAYSRTPTVAIAYSMLLGVPLSEATLAVRAALPWSSPNAGFRTALERLASRLGQ